MMPKLNEATQPMTRALPMQCLEAEIRALSRENGEASPDNEFEVVISTGATVRRHVWWSGKRYEEELVMTEKAIRLDRLNAGASVLNSHNSWDLDSVIGAMVLNSAKLEKGKLVGRVRMYDGPENAATLAKIRMGIIRHVSVGYVVHRYVKIERDGQDELWRAEEWEPYEVSFVPIPADAGAGLRAENQRTFPCHITINRKEEAMSIQDTEATEPAEAKSAKSKATKARAAASEPTPEPTQEPAGDEAAIRAAAIKEERSRTAEIEKIATASKLGKDFSKRHIDAGTSIQETRRLALEQLATDQTNTQGEIRSHITTFGCEGERDKFMRGASEALIAKAGVGKLVADHTKEKIEPGEFRGMTLVRLAEEVLERNGVRTRGMDKLTLVGEALTHRSSVTQSTSDFAVLLENTMHKVLLAAYTLTPDTWTRFCAIGSVSDFRAHNRYRQGSFGTLDQVNELGEFKNKAIPDGEKETITAITKGNIISISRQAIINDDMGAFNSLATRFGRAAKLSIEVDVYNLLKANSGMGPTMGDGITLFHASHANVGTGSAIAAAALDGDRVVMGVQTDPSGNELLDLNPAILVIPKGLGGQARVINLSQYDPDTVANKSQMKPNIVAGLFRDIVDTGHLTGTRRYLFADPAIAPVIEVAFLDGNQEPFLDSQDSWRIDGTEWKVRLDYVPAAVDFRGAVTNAGTP